MGLSVHARHVERTIAAPRITGESQLWRVAAAAMALFLGVVPGGPAAADNPAAISLTIKDHRFEPAEIDVPTGKPVILTIKNEDPTVEEFDSSALEVEKVIAGGTYGTVRLRPLGPGSYPFMGEYHSDTAKGVVISK
jgi:plastocyanin